MSAPSQLEEKTPSERIFLKVSENPNVVLLKVVLEELNRINGEVINLKREVAALKSNG